MVMMSGGVWMSYVCVCFLIVPLDSCNICVIVNSIDIIIGKKKKQHK